MNLLEQFLINQQQNEKPKFNNILPPQQVEQQNQLAMKLQQSGSPIRAVENFLIHPKNALFGMKSPQAEVPISYQAPLIGLDMTQQDYANAEKQGLLPHQLDNPITAGLTETPRIGGLLNDFANGFNENANSRFNINNLDSEKKPISTHIGEGFGTFKRFATSPYGAGLLAGGIGAAMGGGGTALAAGLKAGVGNQQIKTQDAMYRKALEDNGIDTSNISGYIDGDMYKNYTLGNYRYGQLALGKDKLTHSDYNNAIKGLDKQLSEGTLTPEEYTRLKDVVNNKFEEDGIKSAIEAGKVRTSNQTKNTEMRKELLPYQKNALMTMPQVAIGNMGINAGRLGLAQNEFDYKINHPDAAKQQEKLTNLENLHQDLQDFGAMFDTVPNPKAGYSYQGQVAANKLRRNLTSLSPNEQAFETSRQNLKFRILTSLDDSGKRINQTEMQSLEKAIPSLDMTLAQKQSAYKQLDRLLKTKYGLTLNSINNGANIPQQNNPQQQTFKSGKYTVTVH